MSYGKFKDEHELLKAYQSLEKEFTKRNQKLKEYENLLGITKQEPLCYLSILDKLKVTEEVLARILRICGTGDCEIKNKFTIEQFEKLKEDLDILNTFVSENAVGVWVDINEVKDKINNRIQSLKAD